MLEVIKIECNVKSDSIVKTMKKNVCLFLYSY